VPVARLLPFDASMPLADRWKYEEPFGRMRWWQVPRAWLEDERIRSHHFELLMVLAFLVDRPGGLYPSKRFSNYTTSNVRFYSYQRLDKIAKYSWQLHEIGVIELDPPRKKRPAGESFHRFRFADEYTLALASQAPFVKMPEAVIHDAWLEPKLKRTYAALLLAHYVFGANAWEVFAASRSALASWIGCGVRVVPEYTAGLVSLGLVEAHGYSRRGSHFSFTDLHEHYVVSERVARFQPRDLGPRMRARREKYIARRRT
jgi:hypothetical protein